MSSNAILTKLREGALEELVDITLEHVLSQPLHTLIDPKFVHKQILMAISAASQGDQTEQWAKEILDQLRTMAPEQTPHIDPQLLRPIEEFLAFPFHLDEDICLKLMSHEAIEELLRAVLTETLEEFGAKLKNLTELATPKTVSKGFGAFRSLRDKALKATPLGDISQLIERQIQFKTAEHVNKSIGSSISKTAHLLAAESNRHLQGAYRLHILHTLLLAPASVYLKQVDDFGTQQVVELLSQFLAALAQNEGFHSGLSQAIAQSLELWGDKSLRDILSESGLGEDWLTDTRTMLSDVGQKLIETQPFGDWLQRLLDNG